MDTTFLALAVVWFVVVGLFLVWWIHLCRTKGPTLLRRWTEANGWQIARFELDGYFGYAPFGPKGTLQRTVYRVWILDRRGQRHLAQVRVGDPWFGLMSPSSEIAVSWEGAPPPDEAPR